MRRQLESKSLSFVRMKSFFAVFLSFYSLRKNLLSNFSINNWKEEERKVGKIIFQLRPELWNIVHDHKNSWENKISNIIWYEILSKYPLISFLTHVVNVWRLFQKFHCTISAPSNDPVWASELDRDLIDEKIELKWKHFCRVVELFCCCWSQKESQECDKEKWK